MTNLTSQLFFSSMSEFHRNKFSIQRLVCIFHYCMQIETMKCNQKAFKHTNICIEIMPFVHNLLIATFSFKIRSPTPIHNSCNTHGYLSGLAALKAETLFRHYYPEGSWGWVIVTVAVLIAILNHGIQLTSPLYLLPAAKRFSVNEIEAVGK